MASVLPTPAELPPLARPAFEVEELPWEELAALDAAMQVAASRLKEPQAAARLPLLGGAVNVTLEVVSLTHFALRVPPELKQRADAALAGLRFEPGALADGEIELRAPLAAYETVANVLNSARLLRAPARGEHETFDGGGRVPIATLKALRTVARRLQPGEPEYAEQEAREDRELRRYDNIPQALRTALLPFQQEGVRIGLRRSGRLLLADEVGVGKTLQALALATAYADEGPVLVICPASLRFMWAEQAERWWPGLVPSACTVVLCSKDSSKLDDLPRRHALLPAAPSAPRVVITSYHMLQLLALTVNWPNVAWGCVVVDESHNMCTTNGVEPLQTQVAVQVVKEAAHAILLSGTPAMNRPFDLFCQANALWPGLLGTAKEDFARAYCERRRGMHGAFSNSGGTRLRELHLLLRNTIMLRREKWEVECDLPPVRRQVVRLHLTTHFDSSAIEGWDKMDEPHRRGWLKAGAVCDWLKETLLQKNSTSKVVIFVYHIGVLRCIEQNVLTRHLAINEDGTAADPNDPPYVTIVGDDSADARQKAVDRFKRHAHVRVALLSISAACEGLDFSSADAAVFAELPKEASFYTQAEGRVIRRGAKGDALGNINIYTLCAHGTNDETHWSTLSAAASNCDAVHGAHDSGGLVVDDVVDAGPGFVVKPPLMRERPPSRQVAPAVKEPAVPQSAAAREEHEQALPADMLFFEVSCNTGRLHSFLREGEGFKHLNSVPPAQLLDSEAPADFAFPYTSPAVRSAAVAFLAVWNALSAFDRNALWGIKKPLRLPLHEVREAARAAYKSQPSTKRSVKAIDIVPPPRAGSIAMRYVYLRRGTQRLPYQLYISAEGSDPLVSCLLDLCCTESCHDRLRYMTDPKYLRDELFKLEKGVCQMCHLDCDALFKQLCQKGARTTLDVEDRRRILVAAIPRFSDLAYAAQLGVALGWDKEWQLWQADHIIPVAEGGGLCGLENMRTLCTFCHATVSNEQLARGAKRRRDAGAALDPHAAAEQAAVAAWEEEGDEDFEGAREARVKKKRAARKASKKKAST